MNKLPTPEERIVLSSCCKRVCFIEWGSYWCGLCHKQEKAPQEYISVSQILARLKEILNIARTGEISYHTLKALKDLESELRGTDS